MGAIIHMKGNAMDKQSIVNQLYSAAESYGLAATMYTVFGNTLNVRIGYTADACTMPIDSVDFSARAINGLKRAGIFTVGDIIDSISEQTLAGVKNLGQKTISEIKTKVLDLGYNDLTEREKKEFLLDVLERNTL